MRQIRINRKEDKSKREDRRSGEGGQCWKKWTAAPRPTNATRQRLGLGRQGVGSVCLASSAGDWRPATAVDPWKSQQQPPFLGWAVSSHRWCCWLDLCPS